MSGDRAQEHTKISASPAQPEDHTKISASPQSSVDSEQGTPTLVPPPSHSGLSVTPSMPATTALPAGPTAAPARDGHTQVSPGEFVPPKAAAPTAAAPKPSYPRANSSRPDSEDRTAVIVLPVRDEPNDDNPPPTQLAQPDPQAGRPQTMVLPTVDQRALAAQMLEEHSHDVAPMTAPGAPPLFPGQLGAALPPPPARQPLPTQRRSANASASQLLAWLAAAACLLLAITSFAWAAARPRQLVALPFGGAPAIDVTPPELSADEQRDAFIELSDAKPIPWVKTTDEAAATASGDVIWDNAKQIGFLRFNGLAANDPKVSQYQLAIFDDAQRYPIDGGVFDIPNRSGDVVVKIDAKLRVSRPLMFAVTIEKPGGVVVSRRERVLLTAKVR